MFSFFKKKKIISHLKLSGVIGNVGRFRQGIEYSSEEEIIKWGKKPLKIVLKNKSNIGEDTLKLFFKITKNADLVVKCFDVKDEFFGEYNLGNIF